MSRRRHPGRHAGPGPTRAAAPVHVPGGPVVPPPVPSRASASPSVAPSVAPSPVAAPDATQPPPDAVRSTPAGAIQAPPDAVRSAPPEPASRPFPERTEADSRRPTCTAAQLRRFIKSRPWIPMHELRRRFGINGDDDDVTPIRVGARHLYIGLPPAEGALVGELLSAGDVGYELSLDPGAPIVVGVYPMRPVPRG